jgi:riboflavin biosynthesis pyrimidine reductase
MRRLDHGRDLDDALSPYLDADRPPADDRPWVLANMVCGLDGSTAIDGRVGQLSSPTDRQLFVDLRSVADVVLVGAETARRERYGPPKLSAERRARRQDEGRPPVPRIAVVSRSLRLDDAARALTPGDGGERPLVVTCEDSPADARAALDGQADVLVAGTDRVEPLLALGALRRRGAGVVLCEGGPSLLGDLLGAGLVDELCITLAPVVGGDPLPVAVLPVTAAVRRASLAHVLEADGDLFLRYVFPRDDRR